MKLVVTGLTNRIRKAESEGFKWTIPKNHMTLKTGLIPGEINVNVTRERGNALDDRALSHAALEIRKQAYPAFDFLKRYVDGFENAIFLEVALKLGVRKTRRIKGRYEPTEKDVRGEARFPDAISICNSPVDFADEIAFGSTRDVPACATTGEAAGTAAAITTKLAVSASKDPVESSRVASTRPAAVVPRWTRLGQHEGRKPCANNKGRSASCATVATSWHLGL